MEAFYNILLAECVTISVMHRVANAIVESLYATLNIVLQHICDIKLLAYKYFSCTLFIK